jgi:transglycosylase-like protein with SLT domain
MALDASTPIAGGRAATAVTNAIRSAAQATGTNFNYLLATAKIESGLDPNVTMKSSSATGLFQFIDQTWLGTLKQAGPAFGYGAYADAISRTPSGRYFVQDPAMRDKIMNLRKDATANAVMAGVFTQQNAAALIKRTGRLPSDGELYIAHFLGAGGGGKLIELAGNNPQANAAEIFPQAARANKSIFYDGQGHARSVAGVYAELTRRYKAASGSPATATASLGAPSPPAAIPIAPAPVTRAAALASATPISASSVAAGLTSVTPPSADTPSRELAFNSLFSDLQRTTPVDPMVAKLWSIPSSGPSDPPADKSKAAGPPLDLFQDVRPGARALFTGS